MLAVIIFGLGVCVNSELHVHVLSLQIGNRIFYLIWQLSDAAEHSMIVWCGTRNGNNFFWVRFPIHQNPYAIKMEREMMAQTKRKLPSTTTASRIKSAMLPRTRNGDASDDDIANEGWRAGEKQIKLMHRIIKSE